MTIPETSRLIIREYERGDARLAMEYSQEQARRDELPDDVLASMADAEQFIDACIENYRKNGYPLSYAIAIKKSNVLIGEIGLCAIKDGVEISYSISETYAGHGYATEAVQSFAAWAKDELRISTIYGLSKQSNVASWKVLEGAGFALLHEKKLIYYGQEHRFRIYTY